jgi:actin-related protein 5
VYDPGSNIINNWDAMEGVLDYVFVKMGADAATNGISRPIVMTETVANLPYARKSESPSKSFDTPLTGHSHE